MLLFRPSLTAGAGVCSDKPAGTSLGDVPWQNVALRNNLWNVKSKTTTLGLHRSESLYVLKAMSWGSPGSKSLFADFQEFSLK